MAGRYWRFGLVVKAIQRFIAGKAWALQVLSFACGIARLRVRTQRPSAFNNCTLSSALSSPVCGRGRDPLRSNGEVRDGGGLVFSNVKLTSAPHLSHFADAKRAPFLSRCTGEDAAGIVFTRAPQNCRSPFFPPPFRNPPSACCLRLPSPFHSRTFGGRRARRLRSWRARRRR